MHNLPRGFLRVCGVKNQNKSGVGSQSSADMSLNIQVHIIGIAGIGMSAIAKQYKMAWYFAAKICNIIIMR